MVYFDWGNLKRDKGDGEGAIAEYKKSLELDPGSEGTHLNLGLLYQVKGDLDAAIREDREAKRINPSDPYPRQNLGSALMAQNLQVRGGGFANWRALLRIFRFATCVWAADCMN